MKPFQNYIAVSSFNCQTFLSSPSGRPCDEGHCPWLLLAGELHWTPDLSRGCWWCLTAVDTFSCCSSLISTPCQSIVACETDPCLVFGFLAHLHSDNGEPFIAKGSQQCAAGQVSDGVFVLSAIHRHSVLLTMETAYSKIDKKILTLLLHLFLVHTY